MQLPVKSLNDRLPIRSLFFILILLYYLILPHSLICQEFEEGQAAVIIGDRVNFRKKPTLKGKIISQFNIGDKIKVLKIQKHQEVYEKPYDYWLYVRSSDQKGWVYAKYAANTFVFFNKNKTIMWAKEKSFEGAINPYSVRIYDLVNRKYKLSREIQASTISFSPDGQYIAVDSGSDVIRQLDFFSVYKAEPLFTFAYNGNAGKWESNNTMKFSYLIPKGYGVYSEISAKFESGKILRLGLPKKFVYDP